MKKLKTLLVLSGLVTAVLAGCDTKTKSSAEPSTAPASSSIDLVSSNPETPSSVAPSSSAAASSSQVVEEVASITVTSEPTKKSYRVGEEFDAAGLAVKAVYNTGREEALAADAYQLSGFDSASAGLKTITVTYQGKTTTFTVSVFGKDGLAIVSEPDKIDYAVGDEFDATGLKVAVKYGDGSQDELAADQYTVSGFDSSKAGEVTVTVTADGETATFTVYVYAKDWSAADKAKMDITKDTGVLLFSFPYYLSFTLEQGGLHYVDSGEEAVRWYEARTAFEVSEDVLEDYRVQIESIKAGTEQAWNPFETSGATGSTYTSDINYLGFDDESEVYQYARWYQDNPDYNAYQVLSVGLDPDGKLLVVTTVCLLPLAGYGVDGGGYRAIGTSSSTGEEFDMVEELLMVVDERAHVTYDVADDYDISLTDFLELPAYDQNTIVFMTSKGYDSPYIACNMYSNEMDTASFELELTNRYDETGTAVNYTQEDLDALIAKFAARGYEFTLDEESYNIPVYALHTVYNGYDIDVEYYLASDFIIIDVTVNGFELPYTANVYLSLFTSTLESTAESGQKDCQKVPDTLVYDPELNAAQELYLLGFADNASTGFISGISMDQRSLVKGAIRNSKLLTASEVNKLQWTTLSYILAGTAKVGEEANAQYQIVSEDNNTVQFASGEKMYVAVYNPEDGTLAVTITSLTDETAEPQVVNFAATDFTAATGTGIDPFAGTWENADLKLTLGKSSEIATKQGLQFVAAENDGKVMQYTIILNVLYVSGRYVTVCQITVACVAAPQA